MSTPERFHATVKVVGYRIKTGEDMDNLIHQTLSDMVDLRGTPLRLVDFKIYTIEIQPLPPRHETFLTVIAEVAI